MARRATILLLSLIAAAIPLFGQGVDEALKRYKGKVLVLRHPVDGGTRQYDAEGKLLGESSEGSWTAYSGVLIENVVVTPKKLAIDGRRILFAFNRGIAAVGYKEVKNRKFAPYPPKVKLEVQLDHALDSAEKAQAVFSRIFALNTAELMDSLPEFWRACLRDRLVYDASAQREAEFRWQEPKERKFPATQNGDAIEHVGDSVKAPHARWTPEPEYSNLARYQKFQGVVVLTIIVGKDGKVYSVRLLRPLGLGLDEAAEQTVKTWNFLPATRDGQPVAVEINVEVAFNLY
jgi:TonB family protein